MNIYLDNDFDEEEDMEDSQDYENNEYLYKYLDASLEDFTEDDPL